MNDTDPTHLLTIGDFSRFIRLSVRMLRHYDERGLLEPEQVDPFNGHRFYSPRQFKIAARIRTLRDAGCGIDQIARLLPLFDDTEALRAALDAHARSLAAAAQQIADQQSLLANIINQLQEPTMPTMPITVEERTLPARRTLALRRVIPDFAAESELWQEFGRHLGAPDGPPPSRLGPLWGATYFDGEYRDSDVDVSIWAQLQGDLTPLAGFTLEQTPEQRVAWATLYGSYEQMDSICQAIGGWVTSHGHSLAGPMFNIYVVSPAQDPDPDNWVTEVNFPIA
ncbi:MAG: MerR family transcriptional regulator [Propionibacteriaceae bacterium]|jgi:DNA-binding transcriptional MerR regulator|nr:MerR family transcriptional regulator [Propionibacteriaceae bacterium]